MEQVPVKEIMIEKIATISPDERVDVAALIFHENRFHALPVVDEEKAVLGIVTSFDLIEYAYPLTTKAWV